MKNVYDLKFEQEKWKLQKRGSQKPSLTSPRKEDILKKSVELLKKQSGSSSLVIRKKDNSIQSERTYPRSADPRRSKG